ncbi:conserved membrane hypothetical protein [Frankia sp. AiPs1]|uniref:DUF6529 family protein n=1 Tax=Frankia sp. AiPa1 TaxID=573492 RepID=UPI00202B7CA4|nr:DUF6529 family protein [Frankia sp. AiPa1]MCL9761050.1 DUF6529 family protein [Frankia sp. AiPa1]
MTVGAQPSGTAQPSARPGTGTRSGAAAGVLLLGAGVAVALGVYAKAHDPAGRPLFTLGFSGTLPMKAWLTTAALVFVLVQLVTALWMWGRLPGAGKAPAWVGPLHRWSGTTAFVLTLPVAFSCVWSLGFAGGEARVVLHGVAGCAFYGAYAAKMLGLRVRGLPGWALPVLGSLVLVCLVVLWLTASLWFFTQSGIPHV